MKSYRIYIIGRDGRLQLGQAFQAQDDAAASAVARAAAAPGQSIELWEGGRMVGRASEDGVFTPGNS